MSLASSSTIDHAKKTAAVGSFEVRPLTGATFGGLVRFHGASDARAVVAAAEAHPEALPNALDESQGLLLLPGLLEIRDEPELLVRLSRLFGPEVENYHDTLTAKDMIHHRVPEIFLVTNMPPANRQPPPQPNPPCTADGGLPTQFPHRRGWHTDQSFRRPPPDVSLFYAAMPTPKGQGQTLYANGIAAYEALPVAG
jgi:taurine dioxygenase